MVRFGAVKKSGLGRVVESLAFNLMTGLEPPTTVEGEFTEDDARIETAMNSSILRNGAGLNVGHSFHLLDLKAAFERLVKDQKVETSVVSWSPPGDPFYFQNVAATRGSEGLVEVPVAALQRALNKRDFPRATVAMLHDHRAHPLREIFEKSFGIPAGPSPWDREMAEHWTSDPRLNVTLHLYESGVWRDFTRDPMEKIDAFARRIIDFFDRLEGRKRS